MHSVTREAVINFEALKQLPREIQIYFSTRINKIGYRRGTSFSLNKKVTSL